MNRYQLAVSKSVINQKALFTIVAAVAAFVMLEPIVNAAENTAPNSRSNSVISVAHPPTKAGKPRPATADKDYVNERLKTFIDLPDVPKYSGAGAVFLEGLRYPSDTFGQDVTMTFGVMEQAPQVCDWYKAALQQYQWALNPVTTNPAKGGTGIDGSKGKYNISLVIKPVTGQPYRTRVVLRYKFGK